MMADHVISKLHTNRYQLLQIHTTIPSLFCCYFMVKHQVLYLLLPNLPIPLLREQIRQSSQHFRLPPPHRYYCLCIYCSRWPWGLDNRICCLFMLCAGLGSITLQSHTHNPHHRRGGRRPNHPVSPALKIVQHAADDLFRSLLFVYVGIVYNGPGGTEQGCCCIAQGAPGYP